MERRHQRHVFRLFCPFPHPRQLLDLLRSQIFFLFDPIFCLFPPLRSLVPGFEFHVKQPFKVKVAKSENHHDNEDDGDDDDNENDDAAAADDDDDNDDDVNGDDDDDDDDDDDEGGGGGGYGDNVNLPEGIPEYGIDRKTLCLLLLINIFQITYPRTFLFSFSFLFLSLKVKQ